MCTNIRMWCFECYFYCCSFYSAFISLWPDSDLSSFASPPILCYRVCCVPLAKDCEVWPVYVSACGCVFACWCVWRDVTVFFFRQEAGIPCQSTKFGEEHLFLVYLVLYCFYLSVRPTLVFCISQPLYVITVCYILTF